MPICVMRGLKKAEHSGLTVRQTLPCKMPL